MRWFASIVAVIAFCVLLSIAAGAIHKRAQPDEGERFKALRTLEVNQEIGSGDLEAADQGSSAGNHLRQLNGRRAQRRILKGELMTPRDLGEEQHLAPPPGAVLIGVPVSAGSTRPEAGGAITICATPKPLILRIVSWECSSEKDVCTAYAFVNLSELPATATAIAGTGTAGITTRTCPAPRPPLFREGTEQGHQ